MRTKILYIATYIPAHVFYWLGDLVSKLMHIHHKMEFLFPVYSLFINWSLFFNDLGKHSVWLDSIDE